VSFILDFPLFKESLITNYNLNKNGLLFGGIVDNSINQQQKKILLGVVQTALTRKGYDGFSLTVFSRKNSYEFKHQEAQAILSNFHDLLLNIDGKCLFLLFGRATPETEEEASSLEMIQPFSFSDTITAHHGLVANYEELKNTYNLELKTSIDSEVIPFFVNSLTEEISLTNKTMQDAQDKFGSVVDGSHIILFVKNERLGFINNYLGLWGISLDGDFKLGSNNTNFVVYNTDLSKLYNNQFEIPLYSALWLGGLR